MADYVKNKESTVWEHWLLPLIVWLMGASSFSAQAQIPFEQDVLGDGVVSIEAEHYHHLAATNGHTWTSTLLSLASGGQVMRASPNDGATINSSFAQLSPRLDFEVNFVHTGIHYVVIRARHESYTDDSCHAGLNGVESSTSDRIADLDSNLSWSNESLDGDLVTINVPSTGIQTFNIWMREDGLELDKIVVTKNPNFIPSGHGPRESRAVESTTFAASPQLLSVEVAGVQWLGLFQPLPAVESYTVMSSSNLMTPFAVDGAVNVDGFTFSDGTPAGATSFYRIQSNPLPADTQLGGHVLNRLAYGPTPGELKRVVTGPAAIGPAAFINEQVVPENMTDTSAADSEIQNLAFRLDRQHGSLEDLRAWYALQAVRSSRQLFEILTQFINNHFVTYYWESANYLQYTFGLPGEEARALATEFEYQDLLKWREVLLDPNGTFYDLLKICVESPAMIIYLDTIENEKAAPNENFGRELLELFSMGVDNGYTQTDIEEMARCWTGWRAGPVAPQDVGDPHAPLKTNSTVILQRTTSGWSYREGTSEPVVGWNDVGFTEDASWMPGVQTGIGYADGDDSTVLTNMYGNYSTIYLRRPFTVADTNVALRLNVYTDDGCICYINGQEVARFQVYTSPQPFNGTADEWHGNPDWQSATISDLAGLVNQGGNNILAIHALNRGKWSGSFSIDAELTDAALWSYVFDPMEHDVSNKVLFASGMVDPRFGAPWAGQNYELTLPARSGTTGIQDGYDVISHLAQLPYTMEYLSVKLCRLFVHDDFDTGNYFNISDVSPEAALVRDCMVAWENSSGNLRSVLSVIFASDLFRSQDAIRQKIKTPFEYTVSAIRSIRMDVGGYITGDSDGYSFISPMSQMGMGLFTRSEPNGWPEEGFRWIDTGTINERFRFIQNFMMAENDPVGDPLKFVDYYEWGAHNVSDPAALVQSELPAGDWYDAGKVADYFLGLFYLDEGTANLAHDRTECIEFLNADAGGTPDASPLSGLFGDAYTYDQRIRSLVGLLLANPKFHEQ